MRTRSVLTSFHVLLLVMTSLTLMSVVAPRVDAEPAGGTAGVRREAAGRLEAGDGMSCAITSGVLKCWGEGEYGRLGLGDVDDRGDEPGEMGVSLPALSFGAGRSPVSISVSYQHGCAVLDNGSLACWGWNQWGQLGHGSTHNRGDEPGEMGANLLTTPLGWQRVTAVTTGSVHSCALLQTATVKCWGALPNGYVGEAPGEMGFALPPLELPRVAAVSAGNSFTCALLEVGSVTCWGNNVAGQLGRGHTETIGDQPKEALQLNEPIDLGTGRTALAITTGAAHACALLDNGSVKCWGNDAYGKLGLGHLGTVGDQPGELGDALAAVPLGTGRTATAIAAGYQHTCALLDNGSIKCWGGNDFGQLGLGHTSSIGNQPGELGDALDAVQLGTGRTATAIAAGSYHTCARLNTGAVKCWGQNSSGALGQGHTQDLGGQPGQLGDALPTINLSVLGLLQL